MVFNDFQTTLNFLRKLLGVKPSAAPDTELHINPKSACEVKTQNTFRTTEGKPTDNRLKSYFYMEKLRNCLQLVNTNHFLALREFLTAHDVS